MLGQLDLDPGPKPRRRQQGEDRGGGAENEGGLLDSGVIAAHARDDARRHHHRQQVERDRGERHRLVGDGARHLQLPVAIAMHRQREQRRQAGERQPARGDHARRPAIAEIGGRIKREIHSPQQRQRHHRQANAAARAGADRGVKVMDEHQRADGDHHPEHPGRGEQARRRRSAGRQGDVQRGAGDDDRRDDAVDQPDAGRLRAVAAAPREGEHEAQPGEIPEALGDPRRNVARVDPGDRQRRQRGEAQRDDERGTRQRGTLPAQLGQRDRCEQQRGQRMSPQRDGAQHGDQRAPSGQITTRIVCNRISRSRNGE